jgi:1-acyl-sn-glycerol-3-phosphate acyltransferase
LFHWRKIEVYSYPVIGIFPKLWGVIPVRREEFDRRAVQQVLEVLGAGEIVLVAPEGTRSPSLTQGKEGVAFLGHRSGAPIIPVAIDGTVGFPAVRSTKNLATAGGCG